MTIVEVESYEMEKDQNIELVIEEIDEKEPTEFQKASYYEVNIYYQFRYTFNEDEDPINRPHIARYFIRQLMPYMVDGKYTAGIELCKKGMAPTKPHLHINFMSRTKKDSIRHNLMYHDEKQAKETGEKYFYKPRCYALCIEVNIDQNKFWRYPLKQQKGDTACFVKFGGWPKDIVVHWINTGYDAWLVASEIENKKIEKKEVSDQLSDRLFQYLDNLEQKDDLSLKVGIQQFYIVEEQRPFNRTTALGYFYNYKIKRGLMTHTQLASTW